MQATAAVAPRPSNLVPWSRLGDETLAARAAAGNQAAFGALYERYHDPLLSYCRSILLDAEDAHDATQSALENALRSLPRREPGRPLRPWLFRIAHNEAINIVRRRQRFTDADPDEVLTVPGPEADSEQRSRLTQLVDDLRGLPERQRGALVMRELSGLSYDEIGVALGVSNEAARRAVFDARTALHDAVDGRATACVTVRHSLSDGDRRHLRARGIRAHLRSCNDCASFQRSIGVRQTDLHLLGPWLSGATAFGLVGLGAGGAGGGALLAAGSGTTAAVSGGGLGWAGLPVAVKGLAVAAVVAGTGTAAVEIEQVSKPDRPALSAQAPAPAAAGSAAAAGQTRTLRRSGRSMPVAIVRARRDGPRASTAAVSSTRAGSPAGSVSARRRSPARSAPAAVTAPPAAGAPAVSRPARPPAAAPQPTAATKLQEAIDKLNRIREQIRIAMEEAQRVAGSGSTGSVAMATSLLGSTLSSLQPIINSILAPFGLALPTVSTVSEPPPAPAADSGTSTSTSLSNILAPAQDILGGVGSLLEQLFGRR